MAPRKRILSSVTSINNNLTNKKRRNIIASLETNEDENNGIIDLQNEDDEVFVDKRSSTYKLREKPPRTQRFSSADSVRATNIQRKKTQTKSKNCKKIANKGNPFAKGRNGQNLAINKNSTNVLTSALTSEAAATNAAVNEDAEESWEDMSDDENTPRTSKLERKTRNARYAECWQYFDIVKGKHPISGKMCDVCVCNVLKDGKKCDFKFVKHGTTRLNDHLFLAHKKEEFKPNRVIGTKELQEINVLFAKFIISSNSAFRICEDKYLKVIFF